MTDLNQPQASRNDASMAVRNEAATRSGINTEATGDSGESRLSYKFQRLREKLRAAIASGELSGKLPGERQLARKFRVNAKTLSKALTDLAAEGLLDRSIGRGTFVRTAADASAPQSSVADDRWLIVCDPDQVDFPSIRALCDANPGAQVVTDVSSLRPSFLNSFKSVVDYGHTTPHSFLRDLIVRNLSVVLVGKESPQYSMNTVLIDRLLGATHVARNLMLAGHRRFVAVERRGGTQIAEAIRRTAQRYAEDATVDTAFASEALGAIEMGATAVICDGRKSATEVRAAMEKADIAMPARASLAAVTVASGAPPCTGYYVPVEAKVAAIVQMLRDTNNRRPATVWLAGKYVDLGTTGPTESMLIHAAREQGQFTDSRPSVTR